MMHRRYGLTAALLAALVLGFGVPDVHAKPPEFARKPLVDVGKGRASQAKGWQKRLKSGRPDTGPSKAKRGGRGARGGGFVKLTSYQSGKAKKAAKRKGARGAK